MKEPDPVAELHAVVAETTRLKSAPDVAGRLVIGVHADADACGDLPVMVAGIEAAFAQLVSRSAADGAGPMVLAWGCVRP